jgi:hypothetical protein
MGVTFGQARVEDLVNRINALKPDLCLLVGDIDRGGVFASLLGTLELLEPSDRALIRGYAINKFRGDVSLLEPGLRMIEPRLGIPCAGVIPFLHDLARRDEEGYFYIVERKKDLIISGGYNVYPREVEEAAYQFPGVKEAVAFGVPDAYRGEVVKLVVVPQDGVELEARALQDFCHELLAAYKVPRIIEFRHELPKSQVGKVLRRWLREEAAAEEVQGAAPTISEV